MPAKLREVMGALRGRIEKLPGSCAQNAASSAMSSRATVIPVSARMSPRERDVIVQGPAPPRLIGVEPIPSPGGGSSARTWSEK